MWKLSKLNLNKPMFETKENKKYTVRHMAIFYIIYALVMSLTPLINNKLFNITNPISNVLISNTIAVILSLSYIVKIGKRSFSSLGMSKDKILGNYVIGCSIAVLLLLVMWLVNIIFNGVSTTINTNFNLLLFIFLLIGFMFQGFMEELMMRGVIFIQFSLRFGVIIAIIFNSMIFAAGHLGNADASIISVINTFLFGILTSIMFYYHENLWIVSGLHSAWNFILGPVLGINVSGFDFPTTLLTTTINHDLSYLNGGKYGFEASYLFAIIFVIIITVYIFKIRTKLEND